MSLRDIANADLQEIMNADETGGVTCTLTDPDSNTAEFKVFFNDIHQTIDPGTGEIVTGRLSSIAVLTNELIAEGFDGIRGIADSSSRPWLVTTTDALGRSVTHKVAETYPDASIGLTVLLLELYST